MSAREFFERIMQAQTYQDALELGLIAVAREISSEQLLSMTDEISSKQSDLSAGISWGTVNSNGGGIGIWYCRHATGLGDRSHRKYGVGDDFTIT